MTATLTLNQLQNVKLFGGMTPYEVSALLEACHELSHVAGNVIFAAGDEQRMLYFVTAGTVQIDLQTPNAGERILAELGPGSVFGESSFFHPAPHSATARCLTPVTLVCLERARYDEMRAERVVAALRLAANAADLLASRLQETDRWIVAMLEADQDHKNHAAWDRFREKMGHHFSSAKSVVGPGSMAMTN